MEERQSLLDPVKEADI